MLGVYISNEVPTLDELKNKYIQVKMDIIKLNAFMNNQPFSEDAARKEALESYNTAFPKPENPDVAVSDISIIDKHLIIVKELLLEKNKLIINLMDLEKHAKYLPKEFKNPINDKIEDIRENIYEENATVVNFYIEQGRNLNLALYYRQVTAEENLQVVNATVCNRLAKHSRETYKKMFDQTQTFTQTTNIKNLTSAEINTFFTSMNKCDNDSQNQIARYHLSQELQTHLEKIEHLKEKCLFLTKLIEEQTSFTFQNSPHKPANYNEEAIITKMNTMSLAELEQFHTQLKTIKQEVASTKVESRDFEIIIKALPDMSRGLFYSNKKADQNQMIELINKLPPELRVKCLFMKDVDSLKDHKDFKDIPDISVHIDTIKQIQQLCKDTKICKENLKEDLHAKRQGEMKQIIASHKPKEAEPNVQLSQTPTNSS